MSASLPLIPRIATQDRTSRGVSSVPFPEVEYLRRPISSTNIAISAHLSLGRLNALGRESPFDHDHRLRNIGSGALLFISLLLPWYGAKLSAPALNIPGAPKIDIPSVTANAFEAFGVNSPLP